MPQSTSHEAFFPPVEKLEHPWPETTIVWRYLEGDFRTEKLQEQVASGQDFIVREVLVIPPECPDPKPLSKRAVEVTLRRADLEFERLRGCGITVPRVDWYQFTDQYGNQRALGRVPVIEGEHLPYELENPYRVALSVALEDYYGDEPSSGRLGDVDLLEQYIVGQFRASELADETPVPALCLVDIEPIFDLS